MKKYDNMVNLNTDSVETFLNNLDESDIKDLVGIVANLNRLELDGNGKPVYTGDEIAVIGKFVDFADDSDSYEEDEEDDEDEDEDGKTYPSLENPAPLIKSTWGDGSGEDGTEI